MKMGNSLKMVALACALALGTGCATSRSEVDVNFVAPQSAAAQAPANGKKVYVTAIDQRVFEIKPRSADIPSLKNDEIGDRTITERAIARKRNGYGKGLGDVLLPSGRTVATLVGESVAAAYKQAGYEVVSAPNVAGAQAVTVRVKEFWSWFSPGFFYVTVNNKSHLSVETPGNAPVEITTLKSDGMQAVTDKDWKAITEAGLQEITKELAGQL